MYGLLLLVLKLTFEGNHK